MALNPAILYASLLASRASVTYPMNGPNFDRLALAVASSICLWGINQPQNLALSGISAGVAGAGQIDENTTIITMPVSFGQTLSGLQQGGFSGPLSLSLAQILSVSLSTTFSTSAKYKGVSAGVGVGSDISSFNIVNFASLQGILLGGLVSLLGAGSAIPQMSTALSLGIVAALSQGKGIGSVTGSGSPYPASGFTTSVVV